MGNWWLAASSWQCAHLHPTSCADFFGETWNPLGDSAFLQPRSGALWVLAFPKTKITFEREEISECRWDSENMMGQLLVIGRTVWSPKVPTLKGTEVSWSYVQYFLYLVSSSINASIFSYYMARYLLEIPHMLTNTCNMNSNYILITEVCSYFFIIAWSLNTCQEIIEFNTNYNIKRHGFNFLYTKKAVIYIFKFRNINTILFHLFRCIIIIIIGNLTWSPEWHCVD